MVKYRVIWLENRNGSLIEVQVVGDVNAMAQIVLGAMLNGYPGIVVERADNDETTPFYNPFQTPLQSLRKRNGTT